MADYSDREKEIIGQRLAEILNLRRSREHKDRWTTEWGTKTAIGIFATVKRLVNEIDEGNFDH